MRYFKSLTPSVKIYAAGGQVVSWATVDGAVGWYATDREANIKSLLRCIERKVGGVIQEIEKPEYDDLVGKAKGAPLFRPEREHISAEGITVPQRVPLDPQSGPAEPAVADSGDASIVDAGESDNLSAVPTAPEVRKRGSKRKP